MAFEKIENADLIGKMIAELADVPELTADELKKRFDAASKDVIIPKFNKLIDALAAVSAASNIGMNPPEGITAEQNIAAVIAALAVSVKSNSESSHTHSNKAVIDAITADVKKKYDDLVSLFSAIKTISNVVKDDSTLLPTGKAIVDYVKELGGGDMLKATYDSDDDGVVDDASKLGGQAPAYYQKSTDNTLQTDNKTVTGAINEVYGMAQNGGKNLIGEDFSSEKSYTVGKHVINGNSRYRFIVDHPAGPWDASHVEEILVDKEVEDLNENLTASDNLQFKFATDGEGNYGYLGADGSLIPFSSGNVVPLNGVFHYGFFVNSANGYVAGAGILEDGTISLNPISSTLAYMSLYCGKDYKKISIEYGVSINQANDAAYLRIYCSSMPAGVGGTIYETCLEKWCDTTVANVEETVTINVSTKGRYILIGFDHTWSKNNNPSLVIKKLQLS